MTDSETPVTTMNDVDAEAQHGTPSLTDYETARTEATMDDVDDNKVDNNEAANNPTPAEVEFKIFQLDQCSKGLDVAAIVAGLVATLAFTGVLAPPGGLDDKGKPHAAGNNALDAFIVFNSLAFTFSLLAVLIVLTTGANGKELLVRRWQWIANVTWASSVALIIAYLSALNITFQHVSDTWISVTVITPVLSVLVFALCLFIRPQFLQDRGLA